MNQSETEIEISRREDRAVGPERDPRKSSVGRRVGDPAARGRLSLRATMPREVAAPELVPGRALRARGGGAW